jgi:hypothetical protein
LVALPPLPKEGPLAENPAESGPEAPEAERRDGKEVENLMEGTTHLLLNMMAKMEEGKENIKKI